MEEEEEGQLRFQSQRPRSSFVPLLAVLMISSSAIRSSATGTTTAESSASDRLALLSFKSLLSDPSQALSSWENASLHLCRWRGVTCGDRGGERRVTSLQLDALRLKGTLSPSLANLTFLAELRLPQNQLRGPIPPQLGLLTHLRSLDLSINSLTDPIPSPLFHDCSKLQNLSLSENALSGAVPRNLSNCLQIRIIKLEKNRLEGEIPSDLFSLPKLEELVLWDNRLVGRIPPGISNLSSLTILSLTGNRFQGSIPASIGNLTSLTRLYLSNNYLTGSIPSGIGNLANLARLQLQFNNLSGSIPPEIGNLPNLQLLVLASNKLVGTIPRSLRGLQSLDTLHLLNNKLEARNDDEWGFIDALANCTRLRRIDISINDLGGALPRSIGNLSTSLEWLSLWDNHIAGSIPAEIGKLKNLTMLMMWSNLLGGAIPEELGGLPMLQETGLSQNFLTGGIPSTLGNITRLSRLDLAINRLSGPIPRSLGSCRLQRLNISFNELTGALPQAVLSIPTLTEFIDVSHNSLTGFLPADFESLTNLVTIDVSSNRLSGRIPSTIAQCQVLQKLYMQQNLFEGTIPPTFSQLKGLEELDLSFNKLSGDLPEFLQSFHSMTFLNISYNNFDGEVPSNGAVFSNSSAFSILGNDKLCGGIPELNLPSCSPTKKDLSSAKLITVIAGGIVCLILLLLCFVVRYWFLHSKKTSSSIGYLDMERHRKVSFAELLRATDGFSPANLIGTGSFGAVYKGTVDWKDHKDVAVKVLNLHQTGASRSFLAECEALRNIRHRNLVKILTSCSSLDFQGNDFKALVFEFLPNGSLDKWLHPEADEEGTSTMLSLIQRLNISIDVASSLEYLHHHGPSPIVHCDLKPSNVLLDHNMVAHVGDFGLARYLNKIASTSLEQSTASATLRGTIGYAAPEYGMANEVSTHGDVYSYGILLLEMFTGKRPTDDCFKDGLNLHRYVEVALLKGAVEVVESYLLSEGIEEARGTSLSANEALMGALECITSVLKVGILCSKESPRERMHMEDVSRELHLIRDAFLRLKQLQE